MVTILLSALKIIGILLLCLLVLILALLLLVLFVPIRYKVKGYRRENDEAPVRIAVKVTWLLHILNMAFCYPEETFVRVRIFCFTVFSTEKKEKKEGKKKTAKAAVTEKAGQADKTDNGNEAENADNAKKAPDTAEPAPAKENEDDTQTQQTMREEPDQEPEEPTLSKFFKKLFELLKNIKYTIWQIYDKIKHIIKNIRYYIKIIESDAFSGAWNVCSKEVLSLLKSILPGKLSADFVIGTGDPAGTAKILSVYGILYPVTGDHIRITPEFERSVVEGDFFIKGKVTVIKLLKTAIKLYFNKDLRKVIRLFKKEAA